MIRLFSYACWLLIALSANATHIVGGDMTYQHVKDSQYEVTLHLYIDCELGNPGAISLDYEANISYFDAKTNALLSYDPLNVLTQVNVEQLNYKCLKIEPNACVKQFTFSYLKVIKPGSNGVVISFQRCCRNRSITNLIDPEDIGATFFTTVPPVAIVENNSSAVFSKLPPNFLCTNAPLVFDHSATDMDGDSLVYSIMKPYEGADPLQNRPIPANNPPYNKVRMNTGYTEADMMRGTTLLQIDSKTGMLRVTPSLVGQFVVAVRVEEYRDGKKINEGFRDYQLNVLDCAIEVIANFSTPSTSCDKELYFENMSLGESLSYAWDFGDESIAEDVSSSRQGEWTYAEPGTYTIQLIVSTVLCSDTFAQNVTILPTRFIDARFDASSREACDSLTVVFTSTSDSATSMRWTLGDGSPILQNRKEVEHTFRSPGVYTITLDLVDSNTCNIKDDTSMTVEVLATQRRKVNFEVDYKVGCEADGVVRISEVENNAETYRWVMSDGTLWENKSNSQHTFSSTGYHTIQVYTTDTGRCVVNDSARKEVYISNVNSLIDGITLYNIFTPNNDQYNDCFTIDMENTDCISVRFKIYNRWGEQVFESGEDNNCWDGKDYSTNIDLPEGEYFGIYKFNIEGDEKEYTLSNVINLLRN